MTQELPESSPYIVLGGGVHGLSTAYHLARALDETGQGSGADVIVLERNGRGIEAVLHERQGGWAETQKTVENLGRLARAEGVRIFTGVEVTGFGIDDDRVRTVETDQGSIETDFFVAGAGPWGAHVWRML